MSRKITFAELIREGVLEVSDGYRAKNDELGGDGPIFLRAGLMSSHGFNWNSGERFDVHSAEKLRGKYGAPGDTVITTKGNSVGRSAQVPEDAPEFVYSPHLSFWRTHDTHVVDQGYLRYWALSDAFLDQLHALAHGTDMAPYLSLADQYRLEIHLPGQGQQQAIAAVLKALDDKIAVNRRISATVASLGQARFNASFSEALDHVSAGAPLSSDWKSSTLGENVSCLEAGRRPKGGVAAYDEGVPSIGAESVIGLAQFDYAKTKYVPQEFFDSLRQGVLQSHDILLYKDGGKPGDFKPHVSMFGNGFPFARMCINEHVFRVRLRSEISQEFGYFWLCSAPIMSAMRLRGTGAAIPGINSAAARSIPFVVPPKDRVASFTTVAAPLVNRALQAAAESRVLTQLRDALLPKLMSGQLTVKQAESLVEDAT